MHEERWSSHDTDLKWAESSAPDHDRMQDSPSNLEKRIELLLGVAGRGRTLGAQDGVRPIKVAVVGSLLVTNPFGLRLGALVVFGRIVEVAVAARVQVSIASRAGVAGADPRRGR